MKSQAVLWKTIFGAVIATVAAGTASIALAQYPQMNAAIQIAQARQANAALMHQYNWNSRTEILIKGEVKDMRIELVQYGPTGQLQETLLNDQEQKGTYLPTPIGFLRREHSEHEKKELEQYLQGLKQMLQQYTLPTTGKIYDFLSQAVPAGPDANGNFTLTGYNVVQPGDSMTMVVNAWTKHPRHLTVNTTFQGDAVQLSATFKTMPVSGLNYAAFAEADVPAKNLTVQVQNYDFARLGY